MKRAFTMVEIIVAIAVIAVLMGVMLPALHSLRRHSRQTSCTVNLRQLSTAALSYSVSNREAMPPAVLYFQDGANVRTVCWDFQARTDGTVVPGVLWQYSDTPLETQQCPDYEGNASDAGGDPYTGYNYNTTYVGHEGGYPTVGSDGRVLDGWNTVRMGKPVASFAAPDRTAVFGDGGWKSGTNKFMRAPMNSVEFNLPQVCAGTQAFRHVGECTCCACLDGHIMLVHQPCRGAQTTPALATLVTDFPRNGFLSEDDSAYSGSPAFAGATSPSSGQ